MTNLPCPTGHAVPNARRVSKVGQVPLQLLYLGEDTLARECLGRPRGAIEIVHATPPPGRTFDRLSPDLRRGSTCLFDVLLIDHEHPGVNTLAILQDIVGRGLNVPVVVVGEWDEELAVQALKLGAIDYVTKSRASFRAVYFRLRHLTAHAALLDNHSRLHEAYAAVMGHERATWERLEGRLAGAHAALRGAEQRLTDAEAALRHVEESASAEQRAVQLHAAEQRTQIEAERAREATEPGALERQLADAQLALQRAGASSDEAARRQATLEVEIGGLVAKQEGLEAELAGARAALQAAERQAAQQAAAAAQRQAQLEAELAALAASRRVLETEFADARATAEQQRLRFQNDVAAMRQSAQEHEALVEERAARKRAESERAHREKREQFERVRTGLEADLLRGLDAYGALQRTLEQARLTAKEELERASREHATECSRLEALLAERATQLKEQQAQSRASDEKATGLRRQIGEVLAEHRRHLVQLPVNMCRCTSDGVMASVSQELATLLGYETPEALQKVDLAATVFESSDELMWIIDRCLASRASESIETSWKKRDGNRIIVRVVASAILPDAVDLVVHDITTFRTLEEKLRRSQRMEAVARYGAEVAVTCDNLFKYVKREGQAWLSTIDSDSARYQGELLLDEVTRAAAFLRQLAAYGDEQKNASELVDLGQVLRNLEPVLKRVAGAQVDLILPKLLTPINLDVEAEPVERILVNIAAYGRERMRLGGCLRIEVAPVTLGRRFVAKHPNVQPGAHALLTVHEARADTLQGASPDLQAEASAALGTAPAVNHPGVDIGALQALVSKCGGHLWMAAEPPGDMVLKIHLPRRALDNAESAVQSQGSRHRRWKSRLASAQH